MTVAIRQAEPRDGAAMYRAWQLLRQHYSSVDRRIQHVPVSEVEFVTGLQEMLARPGTVAFVAEDEGDLVGFISGGIERNQPDRIPEVHATIGYIFVDPRKRRAGVGRELFKAICGWAGRQEGIFHLEMPVLAGDGESTAFWQSLGFSPFIQRLWAPLPDVKAQA